MFGRNLSFYILTLRKLTQKARADRAKRQACVTIYHCLPTRETCNFLLNLFSQQMELISVLIYFELFLYYNQNKYYNFNIKIRMSDGTEKI